MPSSAPHHQAQAALRWRNRYSQQLPERPFYTRQPANPPADPFLLHWNTPFAEVLGLNHLDPATRTAVFSGQKPLPGMDPLAAVYAGHQFGHYVPQLGDGRALWLGELQAPDGEHWELQLKGAGQTPYSRFGDGRAVWRSSIREYLCSEAMHGLGIPTTRALALVGSPEEVYRETVESAAVVTRVAPTFIRFGSFEFFYYKGDHDALRQLADFTIQHYFPEAWALSGEERYAAWLADVVQRTAQRMAQWQAVGFAHGVMNTDNLSILGLTLDYGPFGFLDAFDPGFICNHSDYGGRYAFFRQPDVAYWNLERLAEALSPLLKEATAKEALADFVPTYTQAFLGHLRAKLGLATVQPEADSALIKALFRWMADQRVDYTRTFRLLSRFNPNADDPVTTLPPGIQPTEAVVAWAQEYATRLRMEDLPDRQQRMDAVNPAVVLRNYMAQEVIDATVQSQSGEAIEALLGVLRTPFDPAHEDTRLAGPPPAWGCHLVISCSS